MVVYIVFAEDFDAASDTGIEGVFATRQAADARIALLEQDNPDMEGLYSIGEYDVQA